MNNKDMNKGMGDIYDALSIIYILIFLGIVIVSVLTK